MKKRKLIIWDFDGVIADSEKLWVEIWVDLLKERKGISLSAEETKKYIVGISEKTKIFRLQKAFSSLIIEKDFTDEIHRREIFAIENIMEPTPEIENILKNEQVEHCIATGATKDMNEKKLKRLGFDKYFPQSNCFTADMVEKGKPYPDLFLLAAAKMGYSPKDCIVIEDAVSGFQAAKAAGMKVIAFVGAENNNTPEYKQICKAEGVDAICSTMDALSKTLNQLDTNTQKLDHNKEQKQY